MGTISIFFPYHSTSLTDKSSLRMGFDELPTIEQVKLARQRLAIVLFLYLIVSIIALVLLSTRMTRPLRALQTRLPEYRQGATLRSPAG